MTTVQTSTGQRSGLATLRICFLALIALTSAPHMRASARPGCTASAASAPHQSHPDEVARISLLAPQQESFIVRATLPVPQGEVLSTYPTVPLAIVDSDGSVLPTQVEIVTRYPRRHDGADVVEVMARVTRPAGTNEGQRLAFSVIREPHAATTLELRTEVAALLNSPNKLELRSWDVFGNAYTADLLRSVRAGVAKSFKDGSHMQQLGGHEVLVPEDPQGGANATLPHLMGVKTYITTYDLERFMSIDLVVHNGLDGNRPSDSDDDVLNDLYFKRLTLKVPAGWHILTAFGSPFLTDELEGANNTIRHLVQSNPGGKMHWMPRQGQFVRRIMLAYTGTLVRAKETLGEHNLAFCRSGRSPSGAKLWSWWNEQTPRYFPQRSRLPSLAGHDIGGMGTDLRMRLEQVKDQFKTGDSGSYPFTVKAMGWAHPWGSSYGGMTGGNEINLFDGVKTAVAGSNRGYQLMQAISKSYLDRQPCALYGLDGSATNLDGLLIKEGFGAPYLPGTFYLRPSLTPDWFGFDNAPSFQTNAVNNLGLRPIYQEDLAGWGPIDAQHLIRFTRTFKVLAWLGNDAVSKEILQATFERYRLSYHLFPNGAWGFKQASGQLLDKEHVNAYPGQGLGIGRAEAWGIDTAVAAFALGSPAERADIEPWLRRIVIMIERGQSDCTGNIMSQYIYNPQWDPYHVRQSREVGFLDQSLRSIVETVYRGKNAGITERINRVLLHSVNSSIHPPFWSDSTPGPYVTAVVGTHDLADTPDYCFNVPNGSHSSDVDRTRYWNSFAYAYRLSRDPIYLHKAAQMTKSGDLFGDFLSGSSSIDIEAKAGMMALLEELRPSF